MPKDTETHYAIKKARNPVPGQRQDSFYDQLLTVLEMARLAGCYDAYEGIKASYFTRERGRIWGKEPPV